MCIMWRKLLEFLGIHIMLSVGDSSRLTAEVSVVLNALWSDQLN